MKKVIALFLMLSISLGSSITSNATSQEHEVLGTYVEADAVGTEFSVEIAWEGLDFTYNEAQREWDEVNHKYTETTSAGWVADERGIITITNHSNTAIVAKPTYTAESGYEDVSMTYTNVNSENKLELASADSGIEGVAGNAIVGKIGVKPAGTLAKGASDTTIGKITISVEETAIKSFSRTMYIGDERVRLNFTDGMTWEEWVTTPANGSMMYFYIDSSNNQVRSSYDDYVSRGDYLIYAGTSTAVKPSDPIRASVEYEWRYFDPDNL